MTRSPDRTMSQLTIFESEDEKELYEERISICAESGVDPAIAAKLAMDQVENHRHRCEVRDALRKFAKGGRKAFELYLALVEQKRGTESAARLRNDAREQYKKGNKGESGIWL